jgi:hypothetical protein
MDPIEKRELKRQAFARLAAQRRRAGLLRGRVVAISLVCFALLWGIVFVQMATGNDPVLSAKEGAKTSRATARTKRAVEPAEHRERTQGREKAELEPEPEVEEVEPEFIEEEPLVTSQS